MKIKIDTNNNRKFTRLQKSTGDVHYDRHDPTGTKRNNEKAVNNPVPGDKGKSK